MLVSPMMSEDPLKFYDRVPNLPGHMPPLEEPTALGGEVTVEVTTEPQ
jgi:hypothetical protein